MNNQLAMIVRAGRQAIGARDWGRVQACGLEISRQAPTNPEGPFLLGFANKAAGHFQQAADCFSQALTLDDRRYDAAIELAFQYILLNRPAEAKVLLDEHRDRLGNSPMYLNLAGEAYSRMNLNEAAWPLFKKACRLQPNVEMFSVNKASCAVYLGKIDLAKKVYKELLKRNPINRRYHYELSKLERAKNDRHVNEMLDVLRKVGDEPAKNIYLYYALGKELEDLERWTEAFDYYEKAGAAVKTVSDHDVASDVAVIDRIIEVCSRDWLERDPGTEKTSRTPIFIVGLPRTGTTLSERIISSHSMVESIGETQLLQMALRRESGIATKVDMSPEIVTAAAHASPKSIAQAYVDLLSFRLGDAPFFIEKLPENVLYLGFIAKSWPDARIIHMRRHPMDACFAVYKQSYFRFAYSLDDLAEYFLAYDRLSRHWRDTLGERMIEVEYETLVSGPDRETRRMLDLLGLPFEEACLEFDRNAAPIATASSVQVREKMHSRSVGKWKRFERQLQPLRDRLEQGGVAI